MAVLDQLEAYPASAEVGQKWTAGHERVEEIVEQKWTTDLERVAFEQKWRAGHELTEIQRKLNSLYSVQVQIL